MRQVDRHLELSRASASAATVSRLESRATRAQAWALHGALIDQFIASYMTEPEELVLDIDASDAPPHGSQELSQFHAFYDYHCDLPLHVFCGQAMSACYLRPSKIDGAQRAAALIELLVTRLREAWPSTRYIVRATRGSAGVGCCNGANARGWATSSGWRAAHGCTRRWN